MRIYTPTFFIKQQPCWTHFNNHPFVDGNKRTGITAAGLFLQQNGYHLMTTNPELEAFTLKVASSRVEISQIAAWLQANSLSS